MKNMNNKIRRKDYIEMPLSTFLSQFPELAADLPLDVRRLALDDHYIIRLDAAHCKLEIGYQEDDWLIGGRA